MKTGAYVPVFLLHLKIPIIINMVKQLFLLLILFLSSCNTNSGEKVIITKNINISEEVSSSKKNCPIIQKKINTWK